MKSLISPAVLMGGVLISLGGGRLVMAQNENQIPNSTLSSEAAIGTNQPWLGEPITPESAPFLVETCDLACASKSAQDGVGEFRERVYGSHSMRLVRIGNDRDSGYSDLSFLMDSSGQIAGLEYLTTSPNGQATKKSYLPAQLQSAQGVALEEERGVKAITVAANINENSGQGVMRFRYVANGLTGNYKTCDVGLTRTGGGATAAWGMISLTSHQSITMAKIISWSLGITTLQGICP